VVHNPRQLLDAVIRRGAAEDLAAWAGSGRDGLLLLRAEISGRGRRRWTDVHPRDVIDELSAAAAAIAATNPSEFLDVFADKEFDENGYVLTGLGYIDDPRATERLARATTSGTSWARMDAAIGLGRRQGPAAVEALLGLLHDPDYLVRHHTLRSLGAVGDARALAPLTSIVAPSEGEQRLAAEAIRSIEGRLEGERSGGSAAGER
jgi:HEAT repeat protein